MRISASQVVLAEACLRKYAFKYVEGLKEPPSKAQEDGTRAHARVEALLSKGEHPGDDPLGKLIQAAMRPGLLPTPSSALLIEHEFSIPLGGSTSFYGFIDCVVPPEGAHAVVVDHKFVSDLRWAKSPAQLRDDAQAIAYGKAALDLFPKVEHVERRWLYYQKGSTKVRPVAFEQSALDVERAWIPLAERARELAKLRAIAPRANDLEPSLDACSAYGGCPFRAACSASSGKFVFTPSAKSSTTEKPLGGGSNMISLQEQLAKLAAKAKDKPTRSDTLAKTEPAPERPPLAERQEADGAAGVNPPGEATEKPSPFAKSTKAKAAPKPKTESLPWGAKAESEAAPEARPWGAREAVEIRPAEVAPEKAAEVAPEKAAPEKTARKPRAAKSDAPAETPAPPRGQLSVLFGAAVTKFPREHTPPVQLIDLLAPIMRQVAEENNVAHWALIKFAEGRPLLAHAFDLWLEASQWKGTIVVGPSDEARAVHEVLIAHADVVVRGVS